MLQLFSSFPVILHVKSEKKMEKLFLTANFIRLFPFGITGLRGVNPVIATYMRLQATCIKIFEFK